MKKYAIIAAGGTGVRMATATPKQFLEINGKSILWHSVKAFVEAFDDIEIVVVAPGDRLDECRQICNSFKDIKLVQGGPTRFQSVKNGLAEVKGDAVVFVHDAVRCLVTKELIHRCYQEAVQHGSAVPAVAVNDSIRVIEDGRNKVIDRTKLRIIQTPQTFRSGILLPAFDVEESAGFTDEASVVEASGKAIHLVEGEYTNIKITRPLDLLVAERIIQERSSFEQS
jgi:2-C-methyl-D-erythritol 4-phosphate cytidylyltransferase